MTARATRRSCWRICLEGMTVYRRRVHLVVWDAGGLVTVSPFDLYWSPKEQRTFALISRDGDAGLWLPLPALVGHWEFYTGRIAGLRVIDGWGPAGEDTPKYEQIWPTCRRDEDTGQTYYRSDRSLLRYRRPEPMSHT